MQPQDLLELLDSAALRYGNNGLLIYPPGNVENMHHIRYSELLQRARQNSCLLHQIDDLAPGSVVLIHFKSHLENIEWFWSVLIAGYIPTISTPFTNGINQRRKHILHLKTLLEDPLCITREELVPEFAGQDDLRISTVESLNSAKSWSSQETLDRRAQQPDDLAILMLTSGSSGNAKAVCLSHRQILQAIVGKICCHETKSDDTLLNWIALDHVASLIEVHLHAMYLGANQVHVQAADVLQSPLTFLDLLSKHKVAFSFAPNFLLARLRQALTTEMKSPSAELFRSQLDLTCLRTLTSGGEANVVDTCDALTDLLKTYGAGNSVISPGFGMTETCAGCVFNKHCPQGDLTEQREFAALGSCIPGVTMRVTVPMENGKLARPNERGNLEVSGPIVFKCYYNNPSATADAFTSDRWFKTGDQAFIDSSGQLNLVGRSKEIMIINGVKHIPHELDIALEEASIVGVTPGYTLVFSYRSKASHTEHICVVYLPRYKPADIIARVQANGAICRTTLLQTGVRPNILPLDRPTLQKSTLGKLSRANIRAAFERGDYSYYQEVNDKAVEAYKATCYERPTNEIEKIILEECEHIFNLPESELGVNANVFDMGVTSIDLIKLKQRLQIQLKLADIPIVMIMTNPTARSLASALGELQKPHKYDPVVVLQSHGSKIPLWLVHPGVGEVLVFVALAKFMTDRPIYALRARGFDGEEFFHDIEGAVEAYHEAIKIKQPTGPYAIAGYSYGSMLAFEIAKVMKLRNNDEIKFLGSFNLPPHIKFRMQQLDWVECLLNLSYFLELMDDSYAFAVSAELHQLTTRDQVLAHVIRVTAPNRLFELGLDEKKLATWADLALSLQNMAREYDPSGSVDSIDVFYAIPLMTVATSKEEWLAEHLDKWKDFSATAPRFHEVDGAHYTMISPSHVFSFQKKLKSALRGRGL